MLKKLLASSFFILTALVNPSFAGDGCYGGGADVNDSQKTDTRDTEA